MLSKDRITAGDGVKSHEMKGKSIISTQTNNAIFTYLNKCGIKTAFHDYLSETSPNYQQAFIARKCSMIPIEFVARRIATGSFLKRHPNLKEGYRFNTVKLETFYKDDANHDPFWSYESLMDANLVVDNILINKLLIDEMYKVTQLVFEVLERAWSSVDHALIDMKIEFGITNDTKELVVSDVIDNDSWRLWPKGDKRLMLDKQIYRNLDTKAIDEKAIEMVKEKFEIVAERTKNLFTSLVVDNHLPQVAIVMGSISDLNHCKTIESSLKQNKINNVVIRCSSAHKSTQFTLSVVDELQSYPSIKAIVAVAGKSNGLGPVISSNVCVPVISCPPISDMNDIWSSVNLPSGLSNLLILSPQNCALSVANIIANNNPFVWGVLRAKQVYTQVKIIKDNYQLVSA